MIVARPARVVVGPALVVVLGGAATLVVASSPSLAHPIGTVASVIVGIVLLLAGANKLVDRSDWLAQATGLGVPTAVARVVPAVELAVGAALVVGIGWPIAPIAGTALLVAFSVVIARELVAGRSPRCACFGAWSAGPIARSDLWRNAILVVISLLSWLR